MTQLAKHPPSHLFLQNAFTSIVHACHHTHGENRGQLLGANSFYVTPRSPGQAASVFTQSHLIGPSQNLDVTRGSNMLNPYSLASFIIKCG